MMRESQAWEAALGGSQAATGNAGADDAAGPSLATPHPALASAAEAATWEAALGVPGGGSMARRALVGVVECG